MYFPDSCEVASYHVRTGVIDKNGKFKRFILSDDPAEGAGAALGLGVELAVYFGDATVGNANADSFVGPFITSQASLWFFDLSWYEGIESEVTGGNWRGGTLTTGAGLAYGKNIAWEYTLENKYKLDGENYGKISKALGKCLCHNMTLWMPEMKQENKRILTRDFYEIDPYTGETIGRERYVGGERTEKETYEWDRNNFVPIAPGPMPADIPPVAPGPVPPS